MGDSSIRQRYHTKVALAFANDESLGMQLTEKVQNVFVVLPSDRTGVPEYAFPRPYPIDISQQFILS